MIPMVEYLLKNTIEGRIKEIKKAPDKLDKVFRYLPKGYVDQIKRLFCMRDIPVIIGFPREPAQMPYYCIILGQELEGSAGLGMDIDEDFIEDDTGNASISCEVYYDLSSDKNCVDLVGAELPIALINGVFGPDGGRVNYLWDEAGKKLVITDEDIYPEDTLTVEYTYYTNGIESIGTMFNINYRIECWSDNGDLTVYMYHIVKYIMLQTRRALEDEGLVKGNLSGGDLEPVPEYFPSFVFRRTLIFGAMVDNTIESEFDVLQSVHVNSSITQ